MRRVFYPLLAAIMLIGAATVRFTDFTDQPLDFNPSRQLFTAIIARSIYLDLLPDAGPALQALAREHRDGLEKLEPPIFETLSAWGYRLAGGERLWIPRLVSIAAWLVGAGLVVGIGRQLGSGWPGILAGLAYFLFLPLGIYASRSFQIDAPMVILIAGSVYTFLGWLKHRSWKWAVGFGVVTGLAIYVKGVGAILVGPGLALGLFGQIIGHKDDRQSGLRNGLKSDPKSRLRSLVRDPQVWVMAALAIVPALLYYPALPAQTESLYTRSVFYRFAEVLTPSFYIRWLILLDRLLYVPVILAAFASIWLAPKPGRWVLLGLWIGFGLYGIAFPKLIVTHDYYQLPLVLVVALSLIPAADLVGRKLEEQGAAGRVIYGGLLLLAAFYPAWIARSVLLAEDYRGSPSYWELVGEEIPLDGRAIGYSQDYGFRLMYYGWREIGILPEGIPAEEFEETYSGADYFVVTARNQMSDDLAAHLAATYPVVAEGGGYAVYDLQP